MSTRGPAAGAPQPAPAGPHQAGGETPQSDAHGGRSSSAPIGTDAPSLSSTSQAKLSHSDIRAARRRRLRWAALPERRPAVAAAISAGLALVLASGFAIFAAAASNSGLLVATAGLCVLPLAGAWLAGPRASAVRRNPAAPLLRRMGVAMAAAVGVWAAVWLIGQPGAAPLAVGMLLLSAATSGYGLGLVMHLCGAGAALRPLLCGALVALLITTPNWSDSLLTGQSSARRTARASALIAVNPMLSMAREGYGVNLLGTPGLYMTGRSQLAQDTPAGAETPSWLWALFGAGTAAAGITLAALAATLRRIGGLRGASAFPLAGDDVGNNQPSANGTMPATPQVPGDAPEGTPAQASAQGPAHRPAQGTAHRPAQGTAQSPGLTSHAKNGGQEPSP